MEFGVFLPIANNGWLMSRNAPHYRPTFELNLEIARKAEEYGFSFALSMVRFLGFGGDTAHWDESLESFTMMAGIAALTRRIKLFSSVAILTMPPAVVARMASTIDAIAPGRFGVNIVTGWSKPEFVSLGIWPGDEHYKHRYEHASEYVQIMRSLWETGESTFHGVHRQTEGAKLRPRPRQIEIIGAGQSIEGMKFVAEQGDYNFIIGLGINMPCVCAPIIDRLIKAGMQSGRDIGAMTLFMIIAEDSDEEAWAKWSHYQAGIDHAALRTAAEFASHNRTLSEQSSSNMITQGVGSVNSNMGTLIGSYKTVARLLDEMAEMEGLSGVMLTFDEFLTGMDKFGQKIRPLMKSGISREATSSVASGR